MTRFLYMIGLLLTLSACGGTLGMTVIALSTATLIHTDKTVADLAVSWYTKEDCSLLYAAEDEPYCQPYEPLEKDQVAFMNSTLYCYRTLGGVSCYDRPDYTASNETRIDFGNTLISPLNSDSPLASLPKNGLQ